VISCDPNHFQLVKKSPGEFLLKPTRIVQGAKLEIQINTVQGSLSLEKTVGISSKVAILGSAEVRLPAGVKQPYAFRAIGGSKQYTWISMDSTIL